MALKIRMQRGGKTHAPRYRVVVAESSSPRDGKFVEVLGNYNPQPRKNEKELDLKLDRIDYWLGVGAKPSDTVRSMINRARRDAPVADSPEIRQEIEVPEEPAVEANPAEEVKEVTVAEPEVETVPEATVEEETSESPTAEEADPEKT